jgi:hypothetical protein
LPKLPKLRVTYTIGRATVERVVELEQAKAFAYGSHGAQPRVVVEGQAVNSDQELYRLATEEVYEGKEYLEVVLRIPLLGGA